MVFKKDDDMKEAQSCRSSLGCRSLFNEDAHLCYHEMSASYARKGSLISRRALK